MEWFYYREKRKICQEERTGSGKTAQKIDVRVNEAHSEKGGIMLPQDPMILLSYINTKLRDEYSTLQELCKEEDLSQEEIEKTLAAAGYCYEKTRNAFVR